jgi:hypothetical protein
MHPVRAASLLRLIALLPIYNFPIVPKKFIGVGLPVAVFYELFLLALLFPQLHVLELPDPLLLCEPL